ncbi:MAG: UDP-N-acetylglucosamine--N-acetylmuramyl-(pentapeptide) pyrophosphoryl-undecaprenol N-acetylglucosamine transferase [Candidatus Delongbacteria bacterium]|nr:UDP-N-acetylglucosamine--N-acetylmuramyl-(pentapeptide) pyrophosphoryl-undecaprenol N-acetylglucosamine transferase [Candidatus Delongbacteria bacterium]
MKYILTGGGTGGHVYPALAIAEQIKKNEQDAEFLYIGTKNHIESKIVPVKGYRMKFIRAIGMPDKKFSAAMFLFFFYVLFGTLQSIFIVLKYRPDMIIGSGGFVSAPPIFAGHILRKLKLSKTKMFLHEANAEAGKLIKFAGPMCDGVGVSYLMALNSFRDNGKFVGYPVRPEFFSGSKSESRKKLGIDENNFLVFAVGGSQGARTINRAIVDSLKYLSDVKDILIIHVTGRGTSEYNGILDTIRRLEKKSLKESELSFYKRMDYADNIKDYYFSADLIITRGGGTINEIAVCGTPSLIIPKANLSGDHQVMNALSMKNSGASEVVYEEVMTEDNKFFIKVEGKRLAEKIIELASDRTRLKVMSECAKKSVIANANEEIYGFIKDIFKNKPITQNSVKSWQKNPYSDIGANQILNSISKLKRDQLMDNEYLDYIRYRASHFLISSNWNIKNIAVKISGITKDESKVPFLSRLFNDKQVGFVKRNIITAYRQIGLYNETVERDIFTALSDPYWEIQVSALNCIKYFKNDTKQNDKLKPIVVKLFNTGNYEVVLNAIDAYSIFINSEEEINELKQFYYHDNWKIRETVISVLSTLKKENIISAEFLKKQFDGILLTTTGFEPQFGIKKKLKDNIS